MQEVSGSIPLGSTKLPLKNTRLSPGGQLPCIAYGLFWPLPSLFDANRMGPRAAPIALFRFGSYPALISASVASDLLLSGSFTGSSISAETSAAE